MLHANEPWAARTTGVPKAVEITHYNAVANCLQLVQKRSLVGRSEAAHARNARLNASGERWLAPLPMYHAYVRSLGCILLSELT